MAQPFFHLTLIGVHFSSRTVPVWYQESLPEIIIAFSQTMAADRPPNLKLMSSFPHPSLESDGVHLSSFSGLEYLIHLFDSAEQIMDSLDAPPEAVLLKQCESNRVLEDRVLVLEKEHQRLAKVVEHKIAIDSELADYRENERTEDCFMIEGVPLIPSEIVGKPWQDLAVKHVKEVIVPLMGRDLDIVVVQNATARHAGAEVKYCVKMRHVADSEAIHVKFGSFFLGQKDGRPPEFKKYSIRNRVTPETKVRIEILKLLASRYRASNPGSKVQVIGFKPRPLLKITPSSSASDRRIKSFNFIEAVKTLPTNFTASEIQSILQKINNPKLIGRMRSTFVVLSDDDYRKKMSKSRSREGAITAGQVDPTSSGSGPADGTIPGLVSGSNAEPLSASGTRSRSGSSSGKSKSDKSGRSRSLKRGADVSADATPAKK